MPPPIFFGLLKVSRWAWFVAGRERQRQLSELIHSRLGKQRLRGALLVGGGGAFAYTHVDQVPVTGRWQMTWLASWEIAAVDEIVQEAYETSLQEVVDPPQASSAALRTILDGLVAGSPELRSRSWSCHFIRDEAFNACSFQNGALFVTTGLCHAVESQSELACVVGHEMAHVVARHTYERWTLANVTQAAVNLFFWTMALVVPDITSSYQMLFFTEVAMPRLLRNFMTELPFERHHEYEADYIGALFAARAGYDPEAMLALCERRAEVDGEATASRWAEYLQTHPNWTHRRNRIEQYLPELRIVQEHAVARQALLQLALTERSALQSAWAEEAAALARHRPTWLWGFLPAWLARRLPAWPAWPPVTPI